MALAACGSSSSSAPTTVASTTSTTYQGESNLSQSSIATSNLSPMQGFENYLNETIGVSAPALYNYGPAICYDLGEQSEGETPLLIYNDFQLELGAAYTETQINDLLLGANDFLCPRYGLAFPMIP